MSEDRAPVQPPVQPAVRLVRSLASQLVTVAVIVGGIHFTGESPRIAVYGFFMNYVYRLFTMSAFQRMHASGRPREIAVAERLTRRPAPGTRSYPVTAGGEPDSPPASVGGYVIAMLGIFWFTVMVVNVRDEKFVTPAGTVLDELAWAALMALIWWVQDLYDRRSVMDFSQPLTVNLGYNSSETTFAAVSLLITALPCAALASGWPFLACLLCFRHGAAVAEDVRRPA